MAQVRLIPSEYAVSNSNYVTTSNPNNALTNVDSTTYGQFTHNRNSTTAYYVYFRNFNFSSVPSNARINSFTIKVRGLESQLSTSSSYNIRLYNNTTELSGTTADTALSTSANTINIPTGNYTWGQITDYGENFTVGVPLRRNSQRTSGYARIYGVEILVDYSIPDILISSTSNSSTVTVDPGSQYVSNGDSATIIFSDVSDLSSIVVLDNGIDVTSSLVQVTSGSTELNPSEFDSSDSNVSSNAINTSNACTDTTSTTYATLYGGSSGQYYYYWNFNVSGISSAVTISKITLSVMACRYSTYGWNICLCKGTTEISSVNITAQSSSSSTPNGADIFSIESTSFSFSDLSNIKIKAKPTASSSSSRLFLYGADLTIQYTIPSGTYTYTISNISGAHNIIVNDAGDKIFIKVNGTWTEASKIYVKDSGTWKEVNRVLKRQSGSWVEQDDISSMFNSSAIYQKG